MYISTFWHNLQHHVIKRVIIQVQSQIIVKTSPYHVSCSPRVHQTKWRLCLVRLTLIYVMAQRGIIWNLNTW